MGRSCPEQILPAAKSICFARSRSPAGAGVDLVDGENELVAIIRDQQDKEVARITRKIVFVTEKARATYLPEQSRLVADGRTPPVVAVRLTDGAGRPVRAGELISVRIEPPYRARDLERLEDDLPFNCAAVCVVACNNRP